MSDLFNLEALASLILAMSSVFMVGCEIPRDPEKTLERIRDTSEIRAGIIDQSDTPEAAGVRAMLLNTLEQHTAARTMSEQGSAATLLPRLETGDLDLVLGYFVEASPWEKRVAFATPLLSTRLSDGATLNYRVAVRKGENGWLQLVENVSHNLRKQGQQ